MNCPSCGTILGPADRFCPTCGAPVNAQPANQNATQPAAYNRNAYNQNSYNQPDPLQQPQAPQPDPARAHFPLPDPALSIDRQNVSKSLYCSNLASDKVRKGITSSAVVCYICAGLTALTGLLLFGTPYMLVDSVILVVLGVLIQVKQSRVAAVILLAYSLINCLVTLIDSGMAGGWLVIIAGVYAVKCTFALDKEYKAYKGH